MGARGGDERAAHSQSRPQELLASARKHLIAGHLANLDGLVDVIQLPPLQRGAVERDKAHKLNGTNPLDVYLAVYDVEGPPPTLRKDL